MGSATEWWRQGPIYQLPVASFQDSNGDGMGDLAGVEQRLDYLAWLGVRGIWLSPIYRTPFREFGYDVEDFVDVDPRFGSLADFDRLLEAAHRRDIRLLLDWVPNHTSDRHPWFRDSSSSRSSAQRDWYIWRDARPDRSAPNNWISVFGGSVWQWHEATGQFYLHTFLPEQPDLNWRNPEVRDAMHATLEFWLGRGVDGFRIDATSLLLKDEQFRDNPPNPEYRAGDAPDSALIPVHTRCQPGLHDLLAEIRALVAEHGDGRVLLGEMYVPVEQLVAFYGSAERPELHLPLNMSLSWIPWDAEQIGAALRDYQKRVPRDGWPVTMLSTHDTLRIAARTPGQQARVAAMLAFTQRGTVIEYYGEEIGMEGVSVPPERAVDPQGRRIGRNRDPERTPMQWEPEPRRAAFTQGTPWLPVGTDVKTANVADERADSRSQLALYRELIELRRRRPALVHGGYEDWNIGASLLSYGRRGDGQRLIVVLNFTSEPRKCALAGARARILLSTFLDRGNEPCAGGVELRANEGLILERL